MLVSRPVSIHLNRADGVSEQRVQRMAAGHEDTIVVRAAEAEVRAALRKMDVRDGFSRRVVDAYAIELRRVRVMVTRTAQPAPEASHQPKFPV